MAASIGKDTSGIRGNTAPAAWTFTASDFPSLKLWAHFKEATGTAIADLAGNFVSTGSNLVVVENGTADAWANNGCMTSDNTASNNCYVRLESGDAIPADIRAIGSGPIIIELDVNITGGDHTGAFFEVGNSASGTVYGVKFGWNGTSSYPQILVRGTTASAGPYNFTALDDLHTSGRTHLFIVWDRSASDTTGTWNVYRNGILHDITAGVTDYVMATDPGAVNIATNGSVGIGTTTAFSNTDVNCSFYNLRFWMPTEIPSNIATIASELSRLPDRLPDSAKSL